MHDYDRRLVAGSSSKELGARWGRLKVETKLEALGNRQDDLESAQSSIESSEEEFEAAKKNLEDARKDLQSVQGKIDKLTESFKGVMDEVIKILEEAVEMSRDPWVAIRDVKAKARSTLTSPEKGEEFRRRVALALGKKEAKAVIDWLYFGENPSEIIHSTKDNTVPVWVQMLNDLRKTDTTNFKKCADFFEEWGGFSEEELSDIIEFGGLCKEAIGILDQIT